MGRPSQVRVGEVGRSAVEHKVKQETESSQTKSETEGEAPAPSSKPVYVKVTEMRPDGYDSSCLRPLGLCTLGGCCDSCWYRPNHPRFKKDGDG